MQDALRYFDFAQYRQAQDFAGCKMHGSGYRIQDSRYMMQDAGYRMQGTRFKVHDARCRRS